MSPSRASTGANAALATISTPLVVSIDADTHPHPDSLSYLIARVTGRPQDQHTCACAGALVVGNPRTDLVTKMQGWDYRLGINGIKRMQSAYNSALVAQGAFSAYWTEDLRAVGGWPDAIGEDIVLTWTLMDGRGIVTYEPIAVGWTFVPERVRALMKQRSPDGLVASSPVFSSAGHRNHRPTAAAATTIAHTA